MIDVIGWMVREGTKPRYVPEQFHAPRKNNGGTFSLPLEVYQDMERRLLAKQQSARLIAQDLGVSLSTVKSMAERIRKGKPAYRVDDHTPYTDEQVSEMVVHIKAGKSLPLAASLVGIRQVTAWGIIKYRLATTVAKLRSGEDENI